MFCYVSGGEEGGGKQGEGWEQGEGERKWREEVNLPWIIKKTFNLYINVSIQKATILVNQKGLGFLVQSMRIWF